MKILMIVPEPFFSPRGTPFSVYYRTKTLGRLGHEVDLATYPLGRDVALPGATIHRISSIPFIRRVKVGPSLAKLALDFFLFWKVLGMLMTRRYDVVHAHEESVFFCLFYKLIFWRLKIVYDMHSSLPQQLRNFAYTNNRVMVGIFAFLERWAIRWSQAVITICPDLQRTVEALRSKTPSVLIENSLFDEIDYHDRGDEIPESLVNWKRFDGRRIVLYTGTFEHYQGIPLLLESISDVAQRRPGVLFVLIGGNPKQLVAMRDLAETLGVKNHVIFTGILHPNTVKRFIRKADVLVSPRMHGTNSPLKLYEYLSSGRPIVATNLETHTQVLSEKVAVLVPCTPQALASGILSVLDAPEEGARIGREAQRLYRTAYGDQAYAEKLQRVLGYVQNAGLAAVISMPGLASPTKPGPEKALRGA
jgi:glycosyltransferase involved in cell wall biosynthesis